MFVEYERFTYYNRFVRKEKHSETKFNRFVRFLFYIILSVAMVIDNAYEMK